MQFLVSAGESSGDMYAAGVVSRLAESWPGTRFYGCTGPKLKAAGVETIVDSSRLAVVGLAEVAGHLPRIYKEYRRLVRLVEQHRPDAALLTDSPDFHLRLAKHLKRLNVPVFYLVAPQVWAWRPGRVKTIRKLVDNLFCLFPFEEAWFRERGVDATYIGHPLASTVRTSMSREEWLGLREIPENIRIVTLLPGSRAGEARRHLPVLLETVERLRREFPISAILATPAGFPATALRTFEERIRALSVRVVENQTWDAIGHADLALAASGTVTVEAAVLGTPMVTFYRVTPLSWWAGRHLVKVPFLSMVNLIAGREIVPELMQDRMTPANLAAAALPLLSGGAEADRMRSDLASVRAMLRSEGDPFRRAADMIVQACGGAAEGVLVRETMRE